MFFTATLFPTKHKSTRGKKYCKVFVRDKSYVTVYPMKSQDEFETDLHWFCKEVGVPVDLIVCEFSAQKKPSVKRFCNQVGTTLKILERATPWENRAKHYIGLLKESVRKDMKESNSLMVLLDYAIELRVLIHNSVTRPLFQSQGKTPHEYTFCNQSDTCNICNFG